MFGGGHSWGFLRDYVGVGKPSILDSLWFFHGLNPRVGVCGKALLRRPGRMFVFTEQVYFVNIPVAALFLF